MLKSEIKAPFPWYGGKSRAAHIVWAALGDVSAYVEPFAGSLAVLLRRPDEHFDGGNRNEIVNDADQYLANFWRAAKFAPDAVLQHADWPCNEADLHSRHAWLVTEGRSRMQSGMAADPEWFDAQIAGWWLWGINNWTHAGWCRSDGRLPRQVPHLGRHHWFVSPRNAGELRSYMDRLAQRLRHVRVACGDWRRVVPDHLFRGDQAGVFLDPPYSDLANRYPDLYGVESLTVAHEVREWAIAHGDSPNYRIVLAGYEGEHKMPSGWRTVEWVGPATNMPNNSENRIRERLHLSPHCLAVQRQPTLFDINQEEMDE